MPNIINDEKGFVDKQDYLLRLLERHSKLMAEHYRLHIRELIHLGKLDEAELAIEEFQDFGERNFPDVASEHYKKDEKSNSFNAIRLRRAMERSDSFAALLKDVEEKNSMLSLKLEQLSNDNKESLKKFENSVVRIQKLESENNELRSRVQQQRIDEKIPIYVSNVKTDLGNDDSHFILMSIIWSIFGGVFGIAAVIAAFYTLYMNIDFKDINNLQLIYIFTRGIIGIGILSWLSYICLSNSKKYTHESIRRKDRRHALMFGQVFLQIYGSTASKDDAIVVFKDWNMSGDSAFSDQTEQPPGLMSIWNAAKEKVKPLSTAKETT